MGAEKTVSVEVATVGELDNVADKDLKEIEADTVDPLEEILANQEETQKNLDATQLYLGEIGFSPLLSAEEEVYFARRALKATKRHAKE
jgi:RNA polymerase nonessential primary-like sigma factor